MEKAVDYRESYVVHDTGYIIWPEGASQVSLVVKNLPANGGDLRDTSSITGSGRCLEEDVAAHSGILDWRIPWTQEPGGLQSTGSHSRT